MRRDRWKYRDIVKIDVIFSKSTLDFSNILWVVGHFISVVCCILDFTDSIREIGCSLATNSTFLIVFFTFTKVTLKFALSLPVLERFNNFYSVLTFSIYCNS